MNTKSPHILGAATNLLGFSFLVLASIKGFDLPQSGLIDECVALLMILFAASCILSFVSIRVTRERTSAQYETYADYVFLAGLILTLIVALLLAFDVVLFIK